MALSVTINLLKFIPWKLPSLSTLGLKNFYTHRQDKRKSIGKLCLYRVENSTPWPCAYSFQGAVGLLHAQTPQGPDEVESQGLSVFPATYQQANSDLPQDQSLPDKAVNTRPVPWHGDKRRDKNVGQQPVGHAGSTQALITGIKPKHPGP